MCVYLCAVAWLCRQKWRGSFPCSRACAKKCSVALLANKRGLILAKVSWLCRRKAWLILAKAGVFKAQLFGDVTPRQ